jgi:hypothetical protein
MKFNWKVNAEMLLREMKGIDGMVVESRGRAVCCSYLENRDSLEEHLANCIGFLQLSQTNNRSYSKLLHRDLKNHYTIISKAS